MPNYQQQNDRKIKAAFKRLVITKDIIIERGMKELMQHAMLYALQVHDTHHVFHKITQDSYGWSVVHDGKVVAYGVNGGRHGEGKAYANLMAESRNHSEGWVGILLAGMVADDDNRKKPMFFEVDYEMGVLNETSSEIESVFKKYFRPIS